MLRLRLHLLSGGPSIPSAFALADVVRLSPVLCLNWTKQRSVDKSGCPRGEDHRKVRFARFPLIFPLNLAKKQDYFVQTLTVFEKHFQLFFNEESNGMGYQSRTRLKTWLRVQNRI